MKTTFFATLLVSILLIQSPSYGASSKVRTNRTTTTTSTSTTTATKPAYATRYSERSSFISAIEKPSLEANINQGNWMVGGFVTMSETWLSSFNSFAFQASVPVQYFVANKLALGGEFDFFHSGGNVSQDTNDVFIGPRATLFFWNEGKLASYFSTSLLFQVLDRVSDNVEWRNSLGLNYFATPSVAFGPSLQYAHGFGMSNRGDYNSLGLLVGFSIFL